MNGCSTLWYRDSLQALVELAATPATVTPEQRARLNGSVTTVMGKTGFDSDGFVCEVRRAMAGRPMVA